MSFINDVKNELSRIPLRTYHEELAELAAYIRTCSKLRIRQNTIILEFHTDRASVARRIFTLLKSYSNQVEAFTKRTNTFNKRNIYVVSIDDEYAIMDIFHDTGFSIDGNIFDRSYCIEGDLIVKKSDLRTLARALFLTSGTISNPEKGYHLEMAFENQELAGFILETLRENGFNFKAIRRGDMDVLYLKDGESISDFLVFIGAHQSVLRFENIRVMKDIRNNVNRVINFETANINKTVKASMRQINDINFLIDKDLFEDLDEDLKEVALLRLENKDSSLNEVARLSNKYSRTAINYRLKKISDYVDKFRGDYDEGNESKVD